MSEYDERHGGPYDRGSADSYYRRGNNPHYFIGDTYQSPIVIEYNMTEEEIEAYLAGYNNNEKESHYKEW